MQFCVIIIPLIRIHCPRMTGSGSMLNTASSEEMNSKRWKSPCTMHWRKS
nr:MAG TPA: hypothetical protein [Caudoviricetes sp.]